MLGEPQVEQGDRRAKISPRSAAIYGRISTGKEEQAHGLVTQIDTCRAFLDRLGIPIREVKVYQEEGSGRRRDRPVLRRLLHDAAMHKFQVLVVFRLDRLTRAGIPEMFRVLKTVQDSGVQVFSTTELWWNPSAPTADLILAVLAWAAEFESKAISERVSAGIQARKREAARKGEPFVWGRGLVSPLRRDPALPLKALQLREEGLSWTKTAQALRVGRTTARRLCQLGRASRAKGTPTEEATPEDGACAD
jgi:DNA invertase Pin-like site-specific DNA recombinase